MAGRQPSVRTAAAQGAAFLDKYDPGWYQESRIDTRELDLGAAAHCIIGQLGDGIYDPENYLQPLVFKAHGLYGFDNSDQREEENKIDTGLRIPGFTLAEHKNICVNKDVNFKIDCVQLGFERSDGQPASYSALTDAWLAEIHKRRERDREKRRRRNGNKLARVK